MDIERIVADLKRERERLSRAVAALEGIETSGARGAAAPRQAASKVKRRHRLTPEGRRRLSESMKRRWAERKRKGV